MVYCLVVKFTWNSFSGSPLCWEKFDFLCCYSMYAYPWVVFCHFLMLSSLFLVFNNLWKKPAINFGSEWTCWSISYLTLFDKQDIGLMRGGGGYCCGTLKYWGFDCLGCKKIPSHLSRLTRRLERKSWKTCSQLISWHKPERTVRRSVSWMKHHLISHLRLSTK